MYNNNDGLIHERDLDANVRAKLNGIKQDNNVDMNQYATKSDVENKLSTLKNTFSSNIESLKQTIKDTYYSKSDIISKDSLYLAEQDISINTKNIEAINKKIDTLQKSIDSTIEAKIQEYMASHPSGGGSSSGGNGSSITQDQITAINNNIALNKSNISINSQDIQNNLSSINAINNSLKGYRKTNVLIQLSDLSKDIVDKLNKASSGTSPGSADITCNNIGPVYYDGKTLSTSHILSMCNICETSDEITEAQKKWYNNIYDISNNKIYKYKDSIVLWNDNYVMIDNLNTDNTTVSSGYKRFNFDNANYVCNDNAVSIANSLITLKESNEFTLSFYGTKFKLTGTIFAYNKDHLDSTVSVVIDDCDEGLKINTYPNFEGYNTDRTNRVLFGIENLSIGRHKIKLITPKDSKLILNMFIDVDATNSAVIKKEDVLSDYSNCLFDKQDNWSSIPASYGITKSSDLFDLASKTTTDIYTAIEGNITESDVDVEKLLYSIPTNDVYTLSNDKMYRVSKHIDNTTSEEIDSLFTSK